MNLANKLTIFRILLVPIMVIIPFLGIQGDFLGISITWIIIDLIFIIASITDWSIYMLLPGSPASEPPLSRI